MAPYQQVRTHAKRMCLCHACKRQLKVKFAFLQNTCKVVPCIMQSEIDRITDADPSELPTTLSAFDIASQILSSAKAVQESVNRGKEGMEKLTIPNVKTEPDDHTRAQQGPTEQAQSDAETLVPHGAAEVVLESCSDQHLEDTMENMHNLDDTMQQMLVAFNNVTKTTTMVASAPEGSQTQTELAATCFFIPGLIRVCTV